MNDWEDQYPKFFIIKDYHKKWWELGNGSRILFLRIDRFCNIDANIDGKWERWTTKENNLAFTYLIQIPIEEVVLL